MDDLLFMRASAEPKQKMFRESIMVPIKSHGSGVDAFPAESRSDART
jgi:hypothetical protein